MLKRVGIFSLPEGTNPDEFSKYWDKHAADFKKVPGLRKYVINRVTKVIKGEAKFWGLVELWFDSEEAHDQAHSTPEAKRDGADWAPRVTESFSAFVEEKEIL